MAGQCADLGYEEVNLNLGCPSGTVTAKGKGSGMLRDLDALDSFLYTVFSAAPTAISIKTRLGFTSAEEFSLILEIFNRYPVKELTVHPRVRSAFYSGSVDMEAFCWALEHSRAPVCYNGNLCSPEQIGILCNQHPQVDAVMLGRSLIADPGMLSAGGTDIRTLEAFHEELLEAYLEAFGGSRNAMFRLKENWSYLRCKFDGGEKLFKQLRKTTDLSQYKAITKEIFRSIPMRPVLMSDW